MIILGGVSSVLYFTVLHISNIVLYYCTVPAPRAAVAAMASMASGQLGMYPTQKHNNKGENETIIEASKVKGLLKWCNLSKVVLKRTAVIRAPAQVLKVYTKQIQGFH